MLVGLWLHVQTLCLVQHLHNTVAIQHRAGEAQHANMTRQSFFTHSHFSAAGTTPMPSPYRLLLAILLVSTTTTTFFTGAVAQAPSPAAMSSDATLTVNTGKVEARPFTR